MVKISKDTNQTDSAWWYAQQKSRPTMTAMEAFEVPVVGVTFDGRQAVVARLRSSDKLILRRQPQNRFDQNAIEVLSMSGQSVGFIGRDLAATLAGRFDLIGQPVAAIVIAVVGDGSLGNHFGVRIHFELPMNGSTRRVSSDDGVIDEVDLDDV